MARKFPGLAIPNKASNKEEIELEWDDLEEVQEESKQEDQNQPRLLP